MLKSKTPSCGAYAAIRRASSAVSDSPDRATSSFRGDNAILPLVFTCSKHLVLPASWRSLHLGKDGHIELCVVLLYVAGPVLFAEFLDHRRHLFGISQRNSFACALCASSIDSNRRVLQRVLVPLCIRSGHWQQIKLL